MKEKITKLKFFRKEELVIYSIVFIFLICMNFTILQMHSISAIERSPTQLIVKEKISEERFVDWEYIVLETGIYNRDSIIHVNITILPQSNDSVEVYYMGPANHVLPSLKNTTLIPGESFAETYTIIESEGELIHYYCHSVNLEGNATVLWWYEVLYSATPQGFIGIEPKIFTSIFALSIFALVIKHKRRNRK
ncbi:MAG: hypothetical protein ACFFDW_06605 [Candidatus Thorarchaeota archaeon]